MFRRIKSLHLTAVTGVIAMAAASLVALTGPASAAAPEKPGPNDASSTSAAERPSSRANKDGVCNTQELCLYYWQNRKAPGSGAASAKLDLHLSDANFIGDIFRVGSGSGVTANNNARSYLSTETTVYWRVWDGANYTGTQILCIAPGDRGNFANSLWDKASSANWSTTAC